ncbi:arginine--tRNA ligase [Mycoplasmatota bacterium WC44]
MNINEILTTIKEELKKTVVELGYGDENFECVLEQPKDKTHGDYSTNTALRLAKVAKKSPRDVATELMNTINKEKCSIDKLEIAGPGFLNIFLKKDGFFNLINKVIDEGSDYGKSNVGNGTKILLEYVSANPTGFLHIGHARGGAFGDSIANIMEKAGYEVHREFYVNDAGNQINNLAYSIEARYLQELGIKCEMPEDGYHGKEIIGIAKDIISKDGDKYKEGSFEYFKEYGLEFLLNGLKEHLVKYRVEFDEWFRERTLYNGDVEKTVNYLRENGYTYHQENAEWLKTSEFYDEKDRVIYTSDGRNTYLVPDIAYHKNKLDRGYDILIDVLGADHHGYINRLKSSMAMIGKNPDNLQIEILQMVKVYQNGEEVKMSKRSGKAIGLIDLIEEVGVDPIRYFFAARALSSPMDLDLDLALRKTNENPVYYAQYAHARISSVLRTAEEQGIDGTHLTEYVKLNENSHDLLTIISNYEKVINEAAVKRIPHKVANYIQTLASAFHSYYNVEKFLTEDEQETKEKLQLIKAVRIILKDALELIGVSAPEKM